MRTDAWIIALLLAILAGVAGSMAFLSSYKSIGGERAETPDLWPSESRLARDGRPVLLMFAHPMCPCTRASLVELRELISQVGSLVTVHVLFGLPEGSGEDWREGDLWSSAASIDGVRVDADDREQEAHLFGARTSGHVVLYDAGGRLLFSGGITRSRGHAGKSYGREQIALLLTGGESASAESPVFGCPLEDHP